MSATTLPVMATRRPMSRLRRLVRRAAGVLMVGGWVILPLLPVIGLALSAALRVTGFSVK